MAHLNYLDELVREYLLFRGFTITLKSFDGELKVDKDRGFRVDRIVDQFVIFINSYDLVSLRELWNHFDEKIFSKLEHDYVLGVKKLESSLFKFYLVNAMSNGKTDKINEFFSKMTPELQGLPEWRDWFMLPYVKNPEEHPTFSVHFTKQWQDTFLVSLHNFLAIVYQVMPQPALSSYEEEASKLRRLQEENDSLKHKLATLTQCSNVIPETAVPPMDIMDDFYIIAQEAPSSGESHGKSLKSIIRTIGGGLPTTSPVLGRKPTSQDEHCGAQRLQPGKRHGTQGGWTKHSSVDSVPKRSLSLDSRSRRTVRDPSVEKVDRKTSREENFLLLSQERMTEHKNTVTQCKFNASGNHVASCDTDGTLVIWSPGPKTVRVSSKNHFKGDRFLSLGWFVKNERYLVTGSYVGVLRLHDLKDNRLVWTVGSSEIENLANSRILSVSCSPTESNVAFSVINQQTKQSPLYLFDVTTKKLEHSFDLGKGVHANCCLFNHNGSLVMAGCSDGSVRTLDLRNGDCVSSWNTNKSSPVTAIQLSPDHNQCYSFGFDHKLYVHDLVHTTEHSTSIQLPPCKRSPLHGTQSFALHMTGEHVLTACGNHGAIIYQIKSNQVEQVLQCGDHNSMLTVCDWSTANQCTTALSGGVDGLVKISTILTP